MRKSSEQPCVECPFKKSSIKGYLGEASWRPGEFLEPHWHSGNRLPCHMKIDWEKANATEINNSVLCVGYLIMMKNACKLPLDPLQLAHLERVQTNYVDVFSFPYEFCNHHSKENNIGLTDGTGDGPVGTGWRVI